MNKGRLPLKIQVYRYLDANNRTRSQAFIDWAVSLLVEGYDSSSLRVLAGLTAEDNSAFEVESCFLKSLEELDIPILGEEDAIKAYAYEVLTEMVNHEIGKEKALSLLMELFLATEDLSLHDFYLLHFSLEDLKDSEFAYHWKGATRENIDQIIFRTAGEWLEKYWFDEHFNMGRLPQIIQVYRHFEKNEAARSQAFIDWAVSLLEEGCDSPSLRMLAGLVAEDSSEYEVESCFLKSLEELNIPILDEDDAIKAYAYEILTEMVNHEIGKGEALLLLMKLYVDTGNDSLHDFYQLHFSLDDLKNSEIAYHWKGATRENIDQIIDQTARDWLEKQA